MAGDLNSVTLVGRLTRPSEIRYSQRGGSAVVRFSIAVNRRKRTQDGKWEDEPNFFDCVYFGSAAEGVNQYLDKGRQVAVQGELHQDRYTGSDGQTRNRVEIYVNNLNLLSQSQGQGAAGGQFQPRDGGSYSRRDDSARQSQVYQPQNRREQQSAPVPDGGGDEYKLDGPETYGDDDVPF